MLCSFNIPIIIGIDANQKIFGFVDGRRAEVVYRCDLSSRTLHKALFHWPTVAAAFRVDMTKASDGAPPTWDATTPVLDLPSVVRTCHAHNTNIMSY